MLAQLFVPIAVAYSLGRTRHLLLALHLFVRSPSLVLPDNISIAPILSLVTFGDYCFTYVVPFHIIRLFLETNKHKRIAQNIYRLLVLFFLVCLSSPMKLDFVLIIQPSIPPRLGGCKKSIQHRACVDQ